MVSQCAEYYGIPKWKFYDKARTKEGKYTIEGLHFERFNDYPGREYTQARGNGEGLAIGHDIV